MNWNTPVPSMPLPMTGSDSRFFTENPKIWSRVLESRPPPPPPADDVPWLEGTVATARLVPSCRLIPRLQKRQIGPFQPAVGTPSDLLVVAI